MLKNEISGTQRIAPNVEEANEILANNFFNRLTKTNVYVYFISYTAILCYFIYYSLNHMSILNFLCALASGFFVWTFVEYSMHRFSFHYKSSYSAIKLFTFLFHGVHHAYPRDISRSITPLFMSALIAISFFIIFKKISPIYSEGIFSGFILGYLLYTIIHDSTHHFALNYPALKQLKINHMNHHYYNTNKNFGVTSPLWDFVFGTYSSRTTKFED